MPVLWIKQRVYSVFRSKSAATALALSFTRSEVCSAIAHYHCIHSGFIATSPRPLARGSLYLSPVFNTRVLKLLGG